MLFIQAKLQFSTKMVFMKINDDVFLPVESIPSVKKVEIRLSMLSID